MKKCVLISTFMVVTVILFYPDAFAAITVSGTVMDTSDDPVNRAFVTYIGEFNPDNRFSDGTDADGNYEIELPEPTKVRENVPHAFLLG